MFRNLFLGPVIYSGIFNEQKTLNFNTSLNHIFVSEQSLIVILRSGTGCFRYSGLGLVQCVSEIQVKVQYRVFQIFRFRSSTGCFSYPGLGVVQDVSDIQVYFQCRVFQISRFKSSTGCFRYPGLVQYQVFLTSRFRSSTGCFRYPGSGQKIII